MPILLEKLLNDFADGPSYHNAKPIVVARNYEGLPLRNGGRDIDMVVRLSDLPAWRDHLTHAANAQDLSITKMAQYAYCKQFLLEDQSFDSLEIDLLTRLWWRGITWLEPDAVIASAVHHDGPIWHPSPAHEFFITFNHSYLHGGFFPKKYGERLKTLYEADKERAIALLHQLYGQQDAAMILAGIQNDEHDLLNAQNKGIRIRCIIRYFFRRPIQLLWGMLSSYSYDIYLKVRP